MRILITGSSGQLGCEIVRQLRAEHETLGLDLIPGPWTARVANIADRGALADAVRGADAIIHTASLHAPQVASRPNQDFVATNITGTLHLLEAAARAHVRRLVYTSTTSVYGFALVPDSGERAVWVTESLTPRPRDIYDITKLAAEELCHQFARESGIPTICLRTSRFYTQSPELMASYRLYRGADVRDIAAAHVLAVANEEIAFDLFNISARSPFVEGDLPDLLHDAASVILRYFPEAEHIFAARGWRLPRSIDRVYVTAKAEQTLHFRPRHNFAECLCEIAR